MMDAFSPLKPEDVPALSVLSIERATPPRRFWFEEAEGRAFGARPRLAAWPYPTLVPWRAGRARPSRASPSLATSVASAAASAGWSLPASSRGARPCIHNACEHVLHCQRCA